LYRVGRAYGNFYKEGIKAVWYNYNAAKLLRARITGELGAANVNDAAMRNLITRAEWQLLARNNHDIGKLPLFGVLVVVLGEWLALLVPFMPGVVPGTCLIPKQLEGLRVQTEQRRRASFRQGITEPSKEQEVDDRLVVGDRPAGHAEWPMTNPTFVRNTLAQLRADQLHHLSTSMSLHSRLWDRLQIPPPGFLLRSKLTKRLQYLTFDDKMLLHNDGVPKLTPTELDIACQERGLDTLSKKDSALRDSLGVWLARQNDDKGRGRLMLSMLFRR